MKIDWSLLNDKLPTDKSEEQTDVRRAMFARFDPNGNGYVSLAECDKGLKEIVESIGYPNLFPGPVILRAFMASNGISQQRAGGDVRAAERGVDYVEFAEFRVFLIYLKRYLELWQIFDAIDTAEDHRISQDEFQAALPKFAEWGVSVEHPELEFGRIDVNGGGQVLFIEFADWGLKQTLKLSDSDTA